MAAASPPVRAHLTRAPRVTSARPVSVILRPRAEAVTALTTTSSSAAAKVPATVMPARSVIRRSAPAHAFVPARPANRRGHTAPVSITSNRDGPDNVVTIAVAEHRIVPFGQCGTPGAGAGPGSATPRPARTSALVPSPPAIPEDVLRKLQRRRSREAESRFNWARTPPPHSDIDCPNAVRRESDLSTARGSYN